MRLLGAFVIHMAVLNACNTFPVTRRDADPIEDLKGGLLVLSNFLKSLVSHHRRQVYEQSFRFLYANLYYVQNSAHSPLL